jgi:hypothetical protein
MRISPPDRTAEICPCLLGPADIAAVRRHWRRNRTARAEPSADERFPTVRQCQVDQADRLTHAQ